MVLDLPQQLDAHLGRGLAVVAQHDFQRRHRFRRQFRLQPFHDQLGFGLGPAPQTAEEFIELPLPVPQRFVELLIPRRPRHRS